MPSVLSLFAVAPLLVLLWWIALRRRFLLYLLLFVLVAFVWRLASSIYIDAGGPLYAQQLFRTIGGGTSSLVLVATYALTILAVVVVFSPTRLRSLAEMPANAGTSLLPLSSLPLRSVVFGAVLLFDAMLFADMGRGGLIPLVAGVEEYVFSQRCAGAFHGVLIRYGDFLCFYLGLFHSTPLLRDKKPDRRFLLLFLVILVYMLLAGHRLSAFYRYTTLFVMPLAVVVLYEQFRPQAPRGGVGRAGRARPSYLPDVAVVAVAAIALVGFGVYRSLFHRVTSECPTAGRPTSAAVASGGEVVASKKHGVARYLQQRVLVQQAELWWVTYERIFLKSDFEPLRAFTRVFTHPILPPRRNSTIPYLMERAIGERAYPILAAGSQYTGGFPEIFFELFGKTMAFPAILGTSFIMGWLLLMLVESVLLQRSVRTFLVFYVLYAFLLVPVTGMLNFLVNWRFWLKVIALVAWLIFEERRHDVSVINIPSVSSVQVVEPPMKS